MKPKIQGTLTLDELLKGEELNFICYFSSSSAILGDFGCCDYAIANRFLMSYAHYRNQGKHQGKAIVINWPLWREGGMGIGDEKNSQMYLESSGQRFLEAEEGINLFEQILFQQKTQHLIIAGQPSRVQRFLGLSEEKTLPTIIASPVVKGRRSVSRTDGTKSGILKEKSTAYIKKLVGEILEIPFNKINSEELLEKYGIDSILVVQMTYHFSKVFPDISSTLFFEYQTIDALVEYFLKTQKDLLIKLVGLEEQEFTEEKPYDGKIALATPVRPNQSFGRSGRFLQFRSLQLTEAVSPPSLIQDIAIIGLSGRYPEANDINEFWENLKNGKDCISEIPEGRWDHRQFFDEDKSKFGKTSCKWGGFMEGVDQFDPLFFNISPREAEFIDPQDRLFLETVWNLLENAGYTREALQHQYQSMVGVYVGALQIQYNPLAYFNSIANRVSYFFNFQGPSVVIDTACSSSAVAIHMACVSLIKGDCQLAIAGGVNLLIDPKKYLSMSMSQVLGSHLRSRSFGNGDGFLPTEGVGAVLLKPLSKAIQDRDNILAVIKSTASNHGGHTSGFTLPNPNAQAQMFEENFKKSGIDPRTISYVESAANGSALGDAIEITALTKSFKKFTTDQQFCVIGSVKSNIGHAEAASGISQLTKVILQLQHKQLIPSIYTEPLNPNLNLDNTPFYLQRELREWKRPVVKINGDEREFPRRATVNSVGGGGANAHLIIEEFDPQVKKELVEEDAVVQSQIMVFSAKENDRLHAVAQQMLEFIQHEKEISLRELAYTLQIGREEMESRLAIVVNNIEELIQGLKAFIEPLTENNAPKALIPIYTGDLNEPQSGFKNLLAGELGETVSQMLLQEKNPEKIATYWVGGGKIAWKSIYEGLEVHKISLPTYPFAKRRCWIDLQLELGPIVESNHPLESITSFTKIDTSIKDKVVDILSNILGMTVAELNLNKPLSQYGISSITLITIFQQLQTQVDPMLDLVKLQECETLHDIINIIQVHTGNKFKLTGPQTAISIPVAKVMPKTWPQFPELIHLNNINQGRPIFWIHAAIGGVEVYSIIGQKSERPFYGIQARGFMTNRSPLQGLDAVAAYYVHIIQTVQPEGPYDIGGYSLGGSISYEIIRQLQELQQTVNTVVMLDPLYFTEVKNLIISQKSLMLMAANAEITKAGEIPPIYRDELDPNLEEEAYLEQVIRILQSRGLKTTKDELRNHESTKAARWTMLENYLIRELIDPHSIDCYYFRNKTREFWGKWGPFMISSAEEERYNLNQDYWTKWQTLLPNFRVIDVDSPSHMEMFSEPKSVKVVEDLCQKLYSKEYSKEKVLEFLKIDITPEQTIEPNNPLNSNTSFAETSTSINDKAVDTNIETKETNTKTQISPQMNKKTKKKAKK